MPIPSNQKSEAASAAGDAVSFGAHWVARCLTALACGCILLNPLSAQAQQVYRIVGADGKVTFSDKPPAAPAAKVTPVDNAVAANQPTGPTLPLALRQVVGKYPVTLYASSNCAPCDGGRNLLISRGVPFSEKTVTTAQDAQALQQLSGGTSLPFLTIGAQHLGGFSASEWTQYLNAAGYPERTQLPASYRMPAATPLTAPEQPAVPASAVPPPWPTAVPMAPAPNPNNPAGIQF